MTLSVMQRQPSILDEAFKNVLGPPARLTFCRGITALHPDFSLENFSWFPHSLLNHEENGSMVIVVDKNQFGVTLWPIMERKIGGRTFWLRSCDIAMPWIDHVVTIKESAWEVQLLTRASHLKARGAFMLGCGVRRECFVPDGEATAILKPAARRGIPKNDFRLPGDQRICGRTLG